MTTVRRSLAVVSSLATAFIVVLGLFFNAQHRSEARLVAEQNRAALDVAYRASIETYRLDVETRFRLQVMRPEVLDILQQAQSAPEDQMPVLRGRLYRLLRAEYESMQQAGLRQFQFHLADDRAFLRFHRPELAGDPLFAIRPSLRIANAERRPVVGLESGRTYPGFRYVFPIEYAGQYLGSVELSLPFERIHDNLIRLLPQGDYAVLFSRAAVLGKLDASKRDNFVDATLNPAYVMENPTLSRATRDFVQSAAVHTLDPLLRQDPEVQQRMAEGERFALPIRHLGRSYIAVFHPVADVEGRHTAYVVGYTEAPAIAAIYDSTLGQAGVAVVLTILLAAVVGLLLNHRRKLAQSNALLQGSEARFRSIFERANAGIGFADVEGNLLQVNDSLAQLVGYAPDELAGMNVTCLTHPDDVAAEADLLASIRSGERDDYRLEKRCVTKGGAIVWADVAVTVIRDRQGRPVNLVGLVVDISERRQAEARIHELAYHDALTGLPNRLLFNDRLGQALSHAQRNGSRLAVLFLDLDRFKDVNDSLGHDAGDALLREAAARLAGCVRQGDTVSRLGGDEFMVLLPVLGAMDDAEVVARKLLAAVARPFRLADQDVNVSLSVGISLFPDDGSDAATLVKRADAAMYHAKEQGRNNFQFCASTRAERSA